MKRCSWCGLLFPQSYSASARTGECWNKAHADPVEWAARLHSNTPGFVRCSYVVLVVVTTACASLAVAMIGGS